MNRVTLSKEQIRKIDDSVLEFVPIPEWQPEGVKEQCGVYVKNLSQFERGKFEMDCIDQSGDDPKIKFDGMRMRLVLATACDEYRQPIFTEQDSEWLETKNCTPVDRIFEVAMRINRLRKEDLNDLGNFHGTEGKRNTSLSS